MVLDERECMSLQRSSYLLLIAQVTTNQLLCWAMGMPHDSIRRTTGICRSRPLSSGRRISWHARSADPNPRRYAPSARVGKHLCSDSTLCPWV
jgi:hypothetical protein